MKNKTIGLIRVLSGQSKEFLAIQEQLVSSYTGCRVVSFCIDDQPQGINSAETLACAVPKVVALAHANQDKVDGMIISCTSDPAVRELKRSLDIPVVGAGESCFTQAFSIGEHLGGIGIEPYQPESIRDLAKSYQCEVTYRQPTDVIDTNTLEDNLDKVTDNILRLQREGCDTVMLLCTGLSSLEYSRYYAHHFRIAIVDPLEAASEAIMQLL